MRRSREKDADVFLLLLNGDRERVRSSAKGTMEVGCMRDFGVRSYLHNFYQRQGHSSSNRDRKFSSRWWKHLLCAGSFLVFVGLCLLVIAFAVPRKAIDVNAGDSPSVIIIDRHALAYNTHLDASRVLGIALVIIGGIGFTLALLMPTFCHMWCASEDFTEETNPLKVNQREGNHTQHLDLLLLLLVNDGNTK